MARSGFFNPIGTFPATRLNLKYGHLTLNVRANTGAEQQTVDEIIRSEQIVNFYSSGMPTNG